MKLTLVLLFLFATPIFAADLRITDTAGAVVVVHDAIVDYGTLTRDQETLGIRIQQGEAIITARWVNIETLTITGIDQSVTPARVKVEILLKRGQKVSGALVRKGKMKLAGKSELGDYSIDLEKIRMIAPVPAPAARSVEAQTSGDPPSGNINLVEENFSPRNALNATQARRPEKRPFTFSLKISNVGDSNINRSVVSVRSYGVVPSVGFNYQNDSSKNPVEIDYEAARHSYSHIDKWDRISQAMSASYGRRIANRLRSKTEAEVSFKGDSEDHDLDNRYTVSQRLEFRLFPKNRLQAYAAYKIKTDPADASNNAINPQFGGRLIQGLGTARSFEIGYRYETNRTEDPVGRYIRWKYQGEFTTPFPGELTVGGSYRPTLYQRTVKVNRSRVVRMDRRWDLDVRWERPLGGESPFRIVLRP